jgi:hypothetical protein
MKTISILILSILFSHLVAQEIPEKEIKSEVNEVTVFLDGAQVTRNKSIELNQGTSILKFVNLSPFIDAKSVQVKAEGEVTVLSVNHQQNFIDRLEKSKELQQLENSLKEVDEKIRLESTYLSIIREELVFLQENRDIGGRNDQVSVTNLQQAAEFYSNKLTSLKMKEIERNKNLEELNKKRSDLQNQVNTLTSKKDYPMGEVLVKVDAKKTGKYSFGVSYLVGNAGWFPSYDIRAKNINEPVQLIYKANLKQDTKADWNNVKLSFSSSDPNVSGVAPQLETWYLGYNSRPPVYKRTTGSVTGKVMDTSGEPLVGANIIVEGTTIGTVTDMSGNYSITLPDDENMLKYSYIGYQTKMLPVTRNQMNVILEEDATALEEVVVIGYGSRDKSMSGTLQGKVVGVDVQDREDIRIRGAASIAIPVEKVENQTSVNFEIKDPYSVASNNKNYSVDMAVYELPAIYQYYSVPKIDKDAFLIANIVDWEQYNLLEGEANIFFEDTYVGKTLLDVRFASDTLEISLGRDKMVSVEREKIKDFSSKQFIGTKKEETRAWKTTIRNNKNQAINMILLDQVPLSTLEEIEVSTVEKSGGKSDPETGVVNWEFTLEPSKSKEFILRYSVKYPKNRTLIIE